MSGARRVLGSAVPGVLALGALLVVVCVVPLVLSRATGSPARALLGAAHLKRLLATLDRPPGTSVWHALLGGALLLVWIWLVVSIAAEVAVQQQWNLFAILEGAPFQGERALFTNDFSHSEFTTDFDLYLRIGATYKF